MISRSSPAHGLVPAETLTTHFSAFGKLTDSVVMRDRQTGNPRGFGFVTFADASVADRVVQEQHIIDGRTVSSEPLFAVQDLGSITFDSPSMIGRVVYCAQWGSYKSI